MDPDDFWALAGEHCTDRELRVLRLRAAGYQTWEIAATLNVTTNTVRCRYSRAAKRINARKPAHHGWNDKAI